MSALNTKHDVNLALAAWLRSAIGIADSREAEKYLKEIAKTLEKYDRDVYAPLRTHAPESKAFPAAAAAASSSSRPESKRETGDAEASLQTAGASRGDAKASLQTGVGTRSAEASTGSRPLDAPRAARPRDSGWDDNEITQYLKNALVATFHSSERKLVYVGGAGSMQAFLRELTDPITEAGGSFRAKQGIVFWALWESNHWRLVVVDYVKKLLWLWDPKDIPLSAESQAALTKVQAATGADSVRDASFLTLQGHSQDCGAWVVWGAMEYVYRASRGYQGKELRPTLWGHWIAALQRFLDMPTARREYAKFDKSARQVGLELLGDESEHVFLAAKPADIKTQTHNDNMGQMLRVRFQSLPKAHEDEPQPSRGFLGLQPRGSQQPQRSSTGPAAERKAPVAVKEEKGPSAVDELHERIDRARKTAAPRPENIVDNTMLVWLQHLGFAQDQKDDYNVVMSAPGDLRRAYPHAPLRMVFLRDRPNRVWYQFPGWFLLFLANNKVGTPARALDLTDWSDIVARAIIQGFADVKKQSDGRFVVTSWSGESRNLSEVRTPDPALVLVIDKDVFLEVGKQQENQRASSSGLLAMSESIS